MIPFGNFPAGSKVMPSDPDCGQQVQPASVPPGWATFPSTGFTGFYFMNVAGGSAYGLEDPIYLKAGGFAATITDTNDIRITPAAGFPAGSRVSSSDPDAARRLNQFFVGAGLVTINAGPQATTGLTPIAQIAFFSANGNIHSPPPAAAVGAPIYDNPDIVYLDVQPIGEVSPNDVRLCEVTGP